VRWPGHITPAGFGAWGACWGPTGAGRRRDHRPRRRANVGSLFALRPVRTGPKRSSAPAGSRLRHPGYRPARAGSSPPPNWECHRTAFPVRRRGRLRVCTDRPSLMTWPHKPTSFEVRPRTLPDHRRRRAQCKIQELLCLRPLVKPHRQRFARHLTTIVVECCLDDVDHGRSMERGRPFCTSGVILMATSPHQTVRRPAEGGCPIDRPARGMGRARRPRRSSNVGPCGTFRLKVQVGP
jgi:hypothetical protein